MPVPVTLPWPAGQTPYVTPDQLYTQAGSVVASQWPLGVQWGTVPFTSGGVVSFTAQQAVLSMICAEATTRAEEIVGQPLRATLTTENLEGPDFHVTMQRQTLNGRIICSRWPVTQVTSVAVSPNSVWPRVYTQLPAGNFEPEFPVQGLYNSNTPAGAGEGAQTVLVAPGWIDWSQGRKGWRVLISYIAGWPHTCLTQAGTAGSLNIAVDDCTAWAPFSAGGRGAAGIIYDALGGGQEAISCIAASVTAGPGTLTLASPTAYAHAAGIMVSAFPQTVIWAAAELAGAAALLRGATATTIQTTGGRQQKTAPEVLEDLAARRLRALHRTI